MSISTNIEKSPAVAAIILIIMVFSLSVISSLLVSSGPVEDPVYSVTPLEDVFPYISLLTFVLLFWRFVHHREKTFLFLSVGFFWAGSMPVMQQLAEFIFVRFVSNLTPPPRFALMETIWFALSVLVFISAKTCLKTVNKDHWLRKAIITALLTVLAIGAFSHLRFYILPTGIEFLTFSFQINNIIYSLALLFFLFAGIIYYKKFRTERHLLFAWFAFASITFAFSCLVSIFAKSGINVLEHIELLVWFTGCISFIIGLFSDKSLAFETERKLRTSLERSVIEMERSSSEWREMIENTQTAFVVLDEQGKIAGCNLVFSSILNRAYNSVIEKRMDSFIDLQSREQFQLGLQRCLKGHESDFEIDLIGRNGQTVPVFVNAVPGHTLRGKVKRVHLTLTLIERWKESESRLRKELAKTEKLFQTEQEKYFESEREWQAQKNAYSSFLRNADDIMLLLDSRGVCTFINKFGNESTGYDVKNLSRNKLPAFLQDVNRFQRQYGDSVDWTLRGFEENWRIKNGELIRIKWNAKLLIDTKGNRIGIVVVGRDITYQKDIEQKLEKFNHKMDELLLERTTDLNQRITILSQALNFQFNRHDVNSSLLHLCQTVCEVGFSLVAVYLQEQEGVRCHWAAVFRDRKKVVPISVEKMQPLKFVHHSYDGNRITSSYYYEKKQVPQSLFRLHSRLVAKTNTKGSLPDINNLLVIPLMVRQETGGYLFAFNLLKEKCSLQEDVRLMETLASVTMNVLYTQRLIANNKKRITELENESESRLKFWAHTSHDLQTPLSTILSLSELLLLRNTENLAPEQKEQLKAIERAGERLFGLLKNILDFIGMESESKELAPNYISISEFLRSRVDTFQIKSREKKLKIKLKIYKGVPEGILVDDETLSSAVDNLLGNAIKFTKFGQVALSAKSKQRGAALEIAVKDSGVGIQKEKLNDIFAEYKRLREAPAKGSGLGLYIVKTAVDRLGGEITVESQEGKGSTFRMVFPVRQVGQVHMIGADSLGVSRKDRVAKQEAPKRSKSKIDNKQSNRSELNPNLKSGKTILVVDDDKDSHIAMRFLLEDLGYNVYFAASGAEALRLASRKKPHLIFMDLTMPDMDGFKSTHKLKTMRSMKNIPVIAMTGKPKSEWPKARKAGCVDWLSKPFRTRELARKLQQWLSVEV